jgi:two-component system, cell cycle response regulator
MIDDGRQDKGPEGPDGGTRVVPAQPGAVDPARLQSDSAQLLETNRRLRETAQRRDDLLSTAADDLRAPAAALLRHVRRLRRRAASSGADRRALEALDRQAHRVAALADGLAELRTIERGQVLLRRRPIELAALLAEMAEARAAHARDQGVEIALELPCPVSVSADPDRLVELVGRLFDAALVATGRGGRVRLSLEVLPGGVRVAIEDGRGTALRAPGRAERLATSGLAFAVCRGLAELHGGALEIAPRGGGRAALLTLPSVAPAAASDEVREPLRAPAGTGKARLLVVDDDPDAREALAMILGDDYDVVLAGDGREALDAALVARPDVVLMDLYMPRMDGLAALEAMRADPITEDVPVILISARGDELTRARSLDLGAVDFLTKPFSGRELKARLERTLRLTRRETQLQELARTDPLTGLANLRAFRARLEEEVKRARRYRTPLACVMVDMDHLKPINDELGHTAGDAAIGAVAEVIRRELRETDFGARYGGDEFVMLLPHTSAGDARVFAERVCTRLHESSIEVLGRRLPLAASFGIASLEDDVNDDPAQTLVRRADAALYEAKRAGRGQVAAHPTASGDAGAMA